MTVMEVIKELLAKNKVYEDLLYEKEHQAAEYFMHLFSEYFMHLFRQAKLLAHRHNMELEKHNAEYVIWDNELETIRWCIETSGFEELSIHKTADNFVDYIELYSYGKQVAHCDISYKEDK